MDQILPSEVLASKTMKLTWLWITGMSKIHPLLQDAVAWMKNHSSTVAGIAESSQSFESVLYYYMEQASLGNPLCEEVMLRLNKTGILAKLNEMMTPESKDMI